MLHWKVETYSKFKAYSKLKAFSKLKACWKNILTVKKTPSKSEISSTKLKNLVRASIFSQSIKSLIQSLKFFFWSLKTLRKSQNSFSIPNMISKDSPVTTQQHQKKLFMFLTFPLQYIFRVPITFHPSRLSFYWHCTFCSFRFFFLSRKTRTLMF